MLKFSNLRIIILKFRFLHPTHRDLYSIGLECGPGLFVLYQHPRIPRSIASGLTGPGKHSQTFLFMEQHARVQQILHDSIYTKSQNRQESRTVTGFSGCPGRHTGATLERWKCSRIYLVCEFVKSDGAVHLKCEFSYVQIKPQRSHFEKLIMCCLIKRIFLIFTHCAPWHHDDI